VDDMPEPTAHSHSDHSCTANLTGLFEMHPAIFDEITRSWALDENGVIKQDVSKPIIKVPQCIVCGCVFL
jgi:hypothetical protein